MSSPNDEEVSDTVVSPDVVCMEVTVSTVVFSSLMLSRVAVIGDGPGVGPWSPLMHGVLSLSLLLLLLWEALDFFLATVEGV